MTQVIAKRIVFLTCHLSHFCFTGPEWESFICKFVRFCVSLLVIERQIGNINVKLVFGAIKAKWSQVGQSEPLETGVQNVSASTECHEKIGAQIRRS